MNHMKEIAHTLGLEIGEEFKIEGYNDYKYKFDYNLMTLMPDGRWCTAPMVLNKILEGKYKVVKPILTKEEREYLSTVIKPFRNRIKYIVKYLYEYGEYISIVYKVSDVGTSSVIFPSYDEGTTYKGMELGKEYTLEELGLWTK